MYPKDWPVCVSCGQPVLDGHLTCGRIECDEAAARASRGSFRIDNVRTMLVFTFVWGYWLISLFAPTSINAQTTLTVHDGRLIGVQGGAQHTRDCSNDAGLVPQEPSTVHLPCSTPAPVVIPRRQPLACTGTITARVTDIENRFHEGLEPIALSCGNETMRTWRFDRLLKWTLDLYMQRYVVTSAGNVDTQKVIRWMMSIRRAQDRARIDQETFAVLQDVERVCRCSVGYVWREDLRSGYPDDELRERVTPPTNLRIP